MTPALTVTAVGRNRTDHPASTRSLVRVRSIRRRVDMTKTIAIDFDGVFHEYSMGWGNGSIYDRPVSGSESALKSLKEKDYRVVVFSTRAKEQKNDIIAWLGSFGLLRYIDEVTHEKPIAFAYIDDRAIRFTNWRDMVNYF